VTGRRLAFKGAPALNRALFGAILVLHVLLGLGFGLNTPLFESPDEPGHYLFVRFLQAYGRLPVQTTVFTAPRAHHPPGYYALAALLTGWASVPGSPDEVQMQVNPHFGFRAADPGNDNKAFYVQNGPDERWPYQGQALVVHGARLVSLLFSTLAVLATYGAARTLRPQDEIFALFASGMVAFNPMVLFMSGLVNNDTAALVAGTALIYLLTRFVRSGFTARRWALVGLGWSIALLLKASALVLLAPIGLALIFDAWQSRSWRRLFTRGLALAVPAIALTGWWFVRNVMLYGDPLANSAVQLAGGALPAAERLTNLPAKLTWFFDGILGCGPIGPLSLCFPAWVYGAAAIIAFVGVVGALRLLARRWSDWPPSRRRDQGPRGSSLIWLTHAVLIAGTLAAAVSFGMSLQNGWQGRYLFPAYASLALFLAAGLLAWFPIRWRPVVAAITLLASLALSAYALYGMIIPRYGIPPSPSPGELRQAAPLDAQIGSVARVLAYRVDSTVVHPGGVLAVTVYWQALARTASPYTVFIHLYSPETGSIAQRDTYPGLGNYATTVWDPGRTFVDTYRLYLPDDATSTEQAFILLGLYDASSGERLSVTGKAAGPAEDAWAQFGVIAVQP
jgi:4-amino-4-deoxy-L-arabinose transferase-like glycosyltransferase